MTPHRTNDHRLAAELADQAGRLLLALRDELADADAGLLRAEGDRRSQELLGAALERERPGDAVLSEEAADDHARLAAERVWIIDPLDGTREFSEPPRGDWAVHVALWVRDREETTGAALATSGVARRPPRPSAAPVVSSRALAGELAVGAVALPARHVTFSTGDPPPLAPPGDGPVRIVVSRTRPPSLVEGLARALGAELVPMGSAGAKAMAVVLGEADAYVHAGGQYEWDSAAPVAVAMAAGLHVSRVDGSPLRYNQPDPLLPDLVICRPELAAKVLAALAGDGRH